VGLKRLAAGSLTSYAAGDPTLNIDPTRNGIEPDFAFTGPNDTVPWVVWYETDASGIGLRGNEMVFAAKAVPDPTADGGFHWQAVGNGTRQQVNVLDRSGTKGFGACAESVAAEDACSLNLVPSRDAEDPRVAAGTLVAGNPTVPWVAWAEDMGNGKHGIFVSRLVGDHFELANNGKPVSSTTVDSAKPDITFSGHTPIVTWQSKVTGGTRTFQGHFTSLTAFKVDTPGGLAPAIEDGIRTPVSSACTADPFTQDGTACPAGDTTPVVLSTLAAEPHKLIARQVLPPGWPKIAKGTLHVRRGGHVRVKLTCPAAHKPRCVGTLKLTHGKWSAGKAKFHLKARHSKKVDVHLTRRARSYLRHHNRLRVSATAGTGKRQLVIRR
jgi:hypothetical protein